MMMCNSIVIVLLVILVLSSIEINAKKTSTKGPDPKECEVCIANLEQIDNKKNIWIFAVFRLP